MLENNVVFILSNAKYDAPIESTGYAVAKHLAKKNKVFYIEYPATFKDYIHLKNSPEFEKKRKLFKRSSDGLLETEHSNLHILITPLLLSINFIPEGYLYRNMLNFNETCIAKRINKIIKKFNIKEFVYINSFNFHYPNISKLIHANLRVYHCVDPIVQSYNAKHGHISEEILIRNSDLVICTSKELYKKKSLTHKHTYFVPNAADFEHSIKANSKETVVLPQIADIKKPIIGYFGNIEARTNYSLLIKVMEMNRDKSFVFVGPISAEYVKKINLGNPNLFLLDPVRYEEMPSVLKGFDVAIIPFNNDKVSHTIFPLKLFEYLGSGKPVVATDFNTDLEEFTKGTVPFCKNAQEFSNSIADALAYDTLEKKDRRLVIARENTWEKRLNEFSDIIDKHMNESLR